MFSFLFHLFSHFKYSQLFYLWAFIAVSVCNSLFTSESTFPLLTIFFNYFYKLFFIIAVFFFPFYLIQKNQITLYFDKYIILFFLYIISALLSLFLNTPAINTYNMLISLFLPLFLSFLFIQTADNKSVEKIFLAFLLFGILNSFLSIGSLISSGFYLIKDHSAIFADRNLYCRFLCIIFAFVTAKYLHNIKSKSLFRWELFVMILVFIQIFYLLSRSGYVLLLVMLLIIIADIKSRKIKLILFFITLVFISLFSYMVIKRITLDKMAVADYSDLHRVNLIYAGIEMIKLSPIIGIGYGQSQVQYKDFMVKELPGIEGVKTIHNCYISIFAEQGIIGLIIFLLLNGGLLFSQYKIIWKYRNSDSYLHLACFSSLLTFMIQGTVYHSFENEGVYWLIVAANIINIREYSKKAVSKNA